MKNTLYIMLCFLVILSCKSKEETAEMELKKAVKDSTIVGADQDEHGCLASAGFTWSKMYNDCVRSFTGLQLNPVDQPHSDDETLCAYVLFSEDQNKAELFIPNTESIILTRNEAGQPWFFQDYQLVPWKGYILKKGDKKLYSGDGAIGNKFSGSTDSESD